MDFHHSKWSLGHGVFKEDSLENIWKQWHHWLKLMDITIQPLDLEETISLIKKQTRNRKPSKCWSKSYKGLPVITL